MRIAKWLGAVLICGVLPRCQTAGAQDLQATGKSIGTVTTRGNLIVMTLDENALGKVNLFDLAHRTLRFTPDGPGYRIANLPVEWDSDFGTEMQTTQVTLHNFQFPFSEQNWDAFSVGATGSIRFGAAAGGRGGRDGGISIGRFDRLYYAAHNLIDTVPAICVFFKPRMNGKRYVKELADRVVITWSLSEPTGNIQDFTWTPTVNRFQAVLRKDGSVDLSYDEMAAKDAIVGLYPTIDGRPQQELATLRGEEHPDIPAHLDLTSVKLTVTGGVLLKTTLETRGPVLPEGGPDLVGVTYRIVFGQPDAAWTVRGVAPSDEAGPRSRYMAAGPGVAQRVKVDKNTIVAQGILPPRLNPGTKISVYAETEAPGKPNIPTVRMQAKAITLADVRNPELHFSTVKREDGPYAIAFESFHYLTTPKMRDLACTVIKSLGDKFDFLTYYSDFRIDNQEAGTPSDGPLGGKMTGKVTGIGQVESGLETYCTAGRFQWEFIQPVYAGSIQAQAQPPTGLADTNPHNIGAYARQLGERSTDGKMLDYNYAMSQVGHEMGHRWSAFVSAKVGNETIHLGDGAHWVQGLQAQVAFPYQRPTEASAMGGGVWQDNFDGTFTQLDDNYYVPATGWSYLDLYLMGLISAQEVPDFFILRSLVPAGRDPQGHLIYEASRTKITIQDVIAAEGPRLPDVYHSQRAFNTGMVVMVEHGKKPSKELMERADGIRQKWIDYWWRTTGGRSTMTTNPR
jgi:hypothetical protein